MGDDLTIKTPDRALIPLLTPGAAWRVHVEWNYIEWWLDRQRNDVGLDLDPDFQRAHVWSERRQRRYVEYVLRGGQVSSTIHFNSPGWQRASRPGPIVLVDGKQRLEAVRRFMADDLRIFGGWTLSDFGGAQGLLRPTSSRFEMHVNDLLTRAEVLQWYLDLNEGGVAHTEDELRKVRDLLRTERGWGK
jgi:hypothetical protein